MHFINILVAFLLPLLALAQDTANTTSTATLTRTIHVSQISTLTLTSSSSAYYSSSSTAARNTTSLQSSTLMSSSSRVVLTTVAPSGTGATTTPPAPTTSFIGAASALSASNVGLAGLVMAAVAALL